MAIQMHFILKRFILDFIVEKTSYDHTNFNLSWYN